MIRHDALICGNALRAALTGWADRATFLAGIPLLLLVAHAAIAPLDDRSLALFGAVIGMVTGYVLVRFTARRLEYHRADGILAGVAHRRGPSLSYGIVLFAVGFSISAAITAIIALRAVPWFAVAVPCGAALGAFAVVAAKRMNRRHVAVSLPRNLGSWLDRPRAGLALAAPVLLCCAIAASSAAPRDAIAIAAIATAIGALALAHVDAAKVRFMAQCGHPIVDNIRREAVPLVIFTVATGAVCALLFGAIGAAIAMGVPVALLLTQPFRVMLYRAYGRRMADWLFAAILAGLCLAWFTAPLAAPIAHAAMLWWTARHTRPARWRIA